MNALPPRLTGLTVNGTYHAVAAPDDARLSTVLRDRLGLTGTKTGCDAGDCGACTVLLDGAQVCACLVPLAQAADATVLTVEGLAALPLGAALQRAFLAHGAAQCGICTPGMLLAAMALLGNTPQPDEAQVMAALGGVLCRCTGYRKIIAAVGGAHRFLDMPPAPLPAAGEAVGARMVRADGLPKLTGAELYGADAAPADALWLRPVRSPHARARFTLGDLAPLYASHPGLVRVLVAADVPGRNGFGIYPDIKDQPVFATGEVRYRGDAVCALVGDRATLDAIAVAELPLEWEVLPPLADPGAALVEGAPALHPRWPAPRMWPRANGRPVSLNTPISSRRPAGRSAWMTGWRSSPRPRRPTWIWRKWPACSASRRARCGSFPRHVAVASAASWMSRCSRCWLSPPGCCGARCARCGRAPRAWRAAPSATRRRSRREPVAMPKAG
jgi:aerobic-type carbon monoxide dehydrogenase small subunit (CoxS/CutS family)